MKKLICILLSCLLLSSCGGRYRYTAEDRPPIYGYSHTGDSLDLNIDFCNLIIEGKVLSNGKVKEVPNNFYVNYPMTEFTVKVKDVKYGEASSRKIKVRIGGRPGEVMWKPEKGDRVVMMLSCVLDEETGENLWCGCYLTFVITSDGLQALSEGPGKSFNGKTKEELYAYIDEIKSAS